jgi:23S rRNA-intervening sequence protein
MRVDPEAAILHKCRELIMQLNVNLNHFPRHEKHGLCLQIRNCAYSVLKGLVECEKRYHNKTSLNRLREYPALYDQLPDTMKRGQP